MNCVSFVMGSLLEKAIIWACIAHTGQVDKAGEPYILHPLHVMSKMNSETDRIVAVLHDVVEDSNITVESIHNSFGTKVANAIFALTHQKKDGYLTAYIPRVCTDSIARRVKVVDLKHNMDMERLSEITAQDINRHTKYRKAQKMIEEWGIDNKELV